MSTATSSLSSYYQSVNLHRSAHRPAQNIRRPSWNPNSKNGYAQRFGTNRRGRANHTIRMDLNAVNSDVVSGVSDFHFPEWSNWFLISIVPLVGAFFTAGKWGPLLKLKDQVDAALDKVEDASQIIEDIAVKVDNIADSMVEKLPEGKLRDAIDKMDDLAEQTIKATDKVQELLHEVDEASDKLEDILQETEKAQTQAGKTTIKAAVEESNLN